MPKEKSCGAVVFRKQKDGSLKYLLLHYEAGHWDFPKGNQEKNETDEQTAIREITEETGNKEVKLIKGFKDTINYFYKIDKDTVYKEVIFFLAESATEQVKISFEHIGYEWMSCEDAHKRLTFKNAKELLKKADEILHTSPNL